MEQYVLQTLRPSFISIWGLVNLLYLTIKDSTLQFMKDLKKAILFLKLIFLYPFLIYSQDSSFVHKTFLDTRNGQVYKTVIIHQQEWFAQNLNFEAEKSYCYDNQTDHCIKHGKLYRIEAAQKACPIGWRIPTKIDFEHLLHLSTTDSLAFNFLINKKYFDADFAGAKFYKEGYLTLNYDGIWWANSSIDDAYYWALSIDKDFKEAKIAKYLKENAFSIRCVKDL